MKTDPKAKEKPDSELEQARAEEALRESEARFRILANAVPSMIWIAAPDGTITYANDQWFHFVGITPEENATQWPEIVLHPDDYERCIREWTHALETVPDEYLIEVRNRRYDGQYRWFQTRAVPLRDEAGQVKGWYGATTDIHDRIEAEKRLALLAEISELIRKLEEPNELLYEISKAVGKHLRVRRCLFNEIDLENDREIVHRDYCNDVASVAGVHKISDYSAVTSAEIAAGKTVVNFDSKIDERTARDYERSYASNGERAYVAVPMLRDNRWIASLWVSDDVPRAWSKEEVGLLETVAERTWAAIERAHAEAALRQSEERFRQAADAANALVYEVDVLAGETAVVYGMERVVGYDPQTTDTTSGWWHSLIHPEDLVGHLAQLDEKLKRGGAFLTEYRVQHKSGAWLTVQDNGLVITENGTPIRIVGAITDITERKQMEEQLSIELANTKQLQYISSQLIQEDNINLLYEQILDAAIALMRSDMGSLQMLFPEKNQLLLLAWRGFDAESAAFWEWVGADSATTCGEALRTGARVFVPDVETCDFMAGTKDLDFYCLFGIKAIQSTPLISRNGHIVGIIATHWCELHQVPERNFSLLDVLARQAADLIERKRAEEAIRRLNEVLETRVVERTAALVESEREVRRMASMLTMAEQEERRRISQLLHDDLQQQLYAIQINLTFAQDDAEAGNTLAALERMAEAEEWLREGIEITRQLTVDLSPPILKSEGLADALNWLISQIKQTHGLEVSLTAEHAFRLPNEDMRVLLFQSIRELLFNTVKHADTDRAAVELRSQKGQLVIHVMDEGHGFNVAEAAARAEREGRFGLFSVRERLRLFGGHMEIDSAPGSGTRILIHMPTDTVAPAVNHLTPQ